VLRITDGFMSILPLQLLPSKGCSCASKLITNNTFKNLFSEDEEGLRNQRIFGFGQSIKKTLIADERFLFSIIQIKTWPLTKRFTNCPWVTFWFHFKELAKKENTIFLFLVFHRYFFRNIDFSYYQFQ
jgi:hypothetical protein